MKIFSKLYVKFQKKLGNKSPNLTYCSSLQPIVVYNFSEIESTFSVPFGNYVADCWWLRGMVSICLIGKGEYGWFFHEYLGLLLDWLIFLLYLLQSVCCPKSIKSISLFSTSVLSWNILEFLLLYVMRSTFHYLLMFSTRRT